MLPSISKIRRWIWTRVNCHRRHNGQIIRLHGLPITSQRSDQELEWKKVHVHNRKDKNFDRLNPPPKDNLYENPWGLNLPKTISSHCWGQVPHVDVCSRLNSLSDFKNIACHHPSVEVGLLVFLFQETFTSFIV